MDVVKEALLNEHVVAILIDYSPDPPLEQVHFTIQSLGPSHPPAKRTPEN